MGYGYSKVHVINDTAKAWKISLNCCHQHDVHSHDGDRTRWVETTIQSYSRDSWILHKPMKIRVKFASSGNSQNAEMHYDNLENFPDSEEIILRIKRVDRKSAELYQDGYRRDACGHPDIEGDLLEEEERRQQRLKREQELARQLEREEKQRKLQEIENLLERETQIELPERKQQVLLEAWKGPMSSIVDDEETSAGRTYDEILASQTAYTEFEESESLQNDTISDRSGYLINFILADYCQANNISLSFHEEILSITGYNDVRLTKKLEILDALSKSVHNFSMFDELEDLVDTIGSHNHDAKVDLFFRLLCSSNVEIAVKILVHCLTILPSRYRIPPCSLTNKEKDYVSLLICNRIWSPTLALKMMYCIDGGDRSEILRKALIYQIHDESLLEDTHSPRPSHVCFSSPSCTPEEVDTLIQLVQERIKIRRTQSTILPECRNELSFEHFVDLIVAVTEKMKSKLTNPTHTQRYRLSNRTAASRNPWFLSMVSNTYQDKVMNENQLRVLIEAIVCKSSASDYLTRIGHEEKSMVVALLAAIQTLLGHTVDIVVSSKTNVTKEVDKWRDFYSSLGFLVCGAETQDFACQSKPVNIVYGTLAQFKSCEQIPRHGNKFTCLIVCDIGSAEHRFPFTSRASSQDRDADETQQISSLLQEYKFCYNLVNGFNINRQEQGMRKIMEIIDQVIDQEKDKSFQQLLNDIDAEAGESVEEIVRQVERKDRNQYRPQNYGYHRSLFQKIQNTFNLASSLSQTAQCVRSQNLNSTSGIANALIAIAELVQKHTNFIPRNNQILAVAKLILEQKRGTGCLLEVATGEGKSTIVAMFAAIQALHGNYVDVVTSSEVLARRDEEEWRPFYEDLRLSSCAIPVPETLSCKSQEEADSLLRSKYQSNIVYGTTAEFAADILRHEFERRNIRGNRKFQVVIVDEVDSMTLDNGLQLTYLSHNTTSLRHVEQLLTTIWCLLSSYRQIEESSGEKIWATKPQYIHTAIAENMVDQADELVERACNILQEGISVGLFTKHDCDKIRKMYKDNKTEELQGQLQSMMAHITQENEEQLIKLQDLTNITFKLFTIIAENKAVPFLDGLEDIPDNDLNSVSMLLLDKGLVCELYTEQDLINLAVDVVSKKITHSEQSDIAKLQESTDIVLPTYLKEYVNECLPTFVENALRALSMTLGREYVVADGRDSLQQNDQRDHAFDRVVPVDFVGTGLLEKNKKWADGLQQFLEMKHQLAISPVSTVTNFMSNYRFFQRYLENGGIHGVTGTLGDKVDHYFLNKHFSTKCLSLPTHRTKKLLRHPMIQIDEGRDSWTSVICERVNEIAKEQTVLLVCEDLRTAKSFETQIRSIEESNVHRVHMYTRSDIHKYDIEKRQYSHGDVIITTTLGGRGTDYKVKKDTHSSGGLFVLLTFFPRNMRVEKQIIGRTARKGEPGMFQLILDNESLPEVYQGHSMEKMHSLRSKHDQERIQALEGNELINVNRREDLFEAFCRKLGDFERLYNSDEKGPYKLFQRMRKALIRYPNRFDHNPGLNSVKERWAFWLTLNRSRIEDNDVKLSFLQNDMICDIQAKIDETQRGESENCYDHARNAMSRMALLGGGKESTHDFGVLKRWQTLIDTEKVYNAVALYNQAYVVIKVKKQGYRQESLDLLDKTLVAIKAYTAEMANVLSCIQIASSSGYDISHLGSNEGQTNFSRQQTARGSFIKAWIEAIEMAKEELNTQEEEKDDFNFYVEPVGLNFAVDVSNDVMEDEMMLMADMGMTYFFKVTKERQFKFCWDALWCFLLGVVQVVTGVLVIGFTLGAGSTFGLGLIGEGISDMIEGTIGMVTGSFSWVNWAISKAISLTTSLVASGLSALKRAAKTAWKGVKGTVSGLKEAANVAAKSATKQTLKASLKTAGKYVGQEIVKQAVVKGTSVLWDKACSAILVGIFKERFRETITTNLKRSRTLNDSLSGAIEQRMLKNPTEQEKDKLNDLIKRTCEKAVAKVLSKFQVFAEIGSQMDKWKGLMSSIASKKSGHLATAITITTDIVQYARMITELIATWPTANYMKDEVALALSAEIHTVFELEEQLEDDFKENSWYCALHDRIYESVCDIVTNEFTEKISLTLVSISQRHACTYVSGKLGNVTANALGRADVNQQLVDQQHSWEMKVDSENSKVAKTNHSQNELDKVNELAIEAADPSKPANDLHLNVLVQSGLIEGGKGVVIDIVDENGKHITSNQFEGKPGTEPIRLRLVQTTEGSRSFVKKCSGKGTSYSGHFERLDADGNVVHTYQPGNDGNSQNCLFDAITHGTDTSPDELRHQVGVEILSDPGRWKELLIRQHRLDLAYRSSYLFAARGGGTDQAVTKVLFIIDHKSQVVDVPNTDVKLTIPEGAIPFQKCVEGTISVHLDGRHHPPLENDQFVIGPTVCVTPHNIVFLKPVVLQLPHSARNISSRNISVWTKSTRKSKWQVLFDRAVAPAANDSTTVRVTEDVVKLRAVRFSWFSVVISYFFGSNQILQMEMRPFMNPTCIYDLDVVYLRVYAHRGDQTKCIENEEKKGNNGIQCGEMTPFVLHFNGRNVSCRINVFDQENKWELVQEQKVLLYENLKEGKYAKCTFIFKKLNSNVQVIHGLISADQAERKLFEDSTFKSKQDNQIDSLDQPIARQQQSANALPQSLGSEKADYTERSEEMRETDSWENQISQRDILDVVRNAELRPDELKHLFQQLEIEQTVIDHTERHRDFHLTATDILTSWRQAYGVNATRRALIDALKECGFNYSKEKLQTIWNLA